MTEVTSWTGCCTSLMTILCSPPLSHTIASDHTCLISHLNVTLPPSQPAYVLDCNSCTINRTALKEDLVTCLSDPQYPSAEDLESALTGILDDHTPTKRCRVCFKKNAPWFSDVTDKVWSTKQQKYHAEKQWLKTELMAHKHIYNSAKKTVTKLVHKTKTSYYCNREQADSVLSCRELLSVTNQ